MNQPLTPIRERDESLFAAFIDWWWFTPIDGEPEPLPAPNQAELESCLDDFKSMLNAFSKAGFVIVKAPRPYGS